MLDWVLELRRRIGIPHALSDLGVRKEHAARFAAMAEVDPSSATNPVPVTAAGMEALYLKAIDGELGSV